MKNQDKQKAQNMDIEEELKEEIAEMDNEELDFEEEDIKEVSTDSDNDEISKLKDLLLRTQADFENFKKRSERDKDDMIFFLKSDIFKKILPRVDDLERMIKNTPDDMKSGALFEWVLALEKSLKKDFSSMWVVAFESIWLESDPHKHDVMTQVPWKDWIIVDEFEKWYELDSRVLRHAKVVVWNWQE